MARNPSETIESVRERIQDIKERARPVVEEASRTKEEVSELFDEIGVDARDGDAAADVSGLRTEVGEFVSEGRDVLEEMDELGIKDEPFREPFSESVDGAGGIIRDVSEGEMDIGREREQLREDELRSLRREARQEALAERREELREEVQDRELDRYRRQLGLDDDDGGNRGSRGRAAQEDRRRRESEPEDRGGVFGGDDGLGEGGIWGDGDGDQSDGRDGGAFPDDEGIW